MRPISILFSILYSSCLLSEASWAGYIGKNLGETTSQPAVKISQEKIKFEGAKPGEDKFYPQSGLYFSSQNNLSKHLKELDPSILTILEISKYFNLSSQDMEILGTFHRLEKLDLSCSHDSKDLPKLSKLANLKHLVMKATQPIFEMIKVFSNLETLDITYQNPTLENFDHLAGLSRVSKLTLSGCIVNPGELEKIKSLPIQELSFADSQLKDGNITSLAQFKHLIDLFFSGSTLNGLEFAALKDLHLNHLMLDEMPLTKGTVKAIGTLKNLEVLTVSIMPNGFRPEMMPLLNSLTNIRIINANNFNLGDWSRYPHITSQLTEQVKQALSVSPEHRNPPAPTATKN